MNGRQITTIFLILVAAFAVPASIFTFVTQNTFDNRDQASSVENITNTDTIKEVTRNPNYYYIFAFVCIMTSILLVLLYFEKRKSNQDARKPTETV